VFGVRLESKEHKSKSRPRFQRPAKPYLKNQGLTQFPVITRCTTPVVSSDELRRYGYQWFLLDAAFGKPKGWTAGRLERMWMAQGEGGQRLFIVLRCS
jgi:hypothetical protein